MSFWNNIVSFVRSNNDAPETLLDDEWRETIPWTHQEMLQLKSDVRSYSPLPQLDVPEARILMVGPVRTGKSSFFNTINSIFAGYPTGQALAGSMITSLTTVFRSYQCRDEQGTPLKFRLCDTRGIESGSHMQLADINFVLGGHIKDGYLFNPAIPISMEDNNFRNNPDLKDKIHCVAFVIDSSSVDVMSEGILASIRTMQAAMNLKDIPQVVLLTKVDQLCKFVDEDVSNIFRSRKVRDVVNKVSESLGLPRSHILPVKNYDREVVLNDRVNILALFSLRYILRFCNDHMYNFV